MPVSSPGLAAEEIRATDGSAPPQNRGGLFGGRGGGGVFQPAPQAPRSGALHGDELPPEEGTAATRQWITNPALGTPTLSTRNIEATKAAIQHYQSIVANGGWPAVPAYAMRPGSTGQSRRDPPSAS